MIRYTKTLPTVNHVNIHTTSETHLTYKNGTVTWNHGPSALSALDLVWALSLKEEPECSFTALQLKS